MGITITNICYNILYVFTSAQFLKLKMKQTYNISIWIKVLEKLKYDIGDELSRMGSDINILPASKNIGSYHQKINMHFNYKTGEVKSVFIQEHSPFPNLDDRSVKSEDFIKQNLELFRNESINQILD